MVLKQYPLDKTFLVAAWLESLVYGCLFIVFFLGVYVYLNFAKTQNTHNRVMFYVSIVMFVMSTVHLAMNCFRLIRGYVDFRLAPGGPVGYLGTLGTWDHIFKDTIYATQSILGDAVAVYRCWIIWGGDWRFVVFPGMLLVVSTISGYMVCGLYTTVDPNATVFDPRLTNWITTFYSVAVAQNIITTGLMSFRLWQVEKKSSRYRLGGGNFLPLLYILVESAALYLFIELILLALYAVDYNAQYILLEIVTPTVAITFTVISMRITLRSQKKIGNASSSTGNTHNGAQTVGSIPMRHIVISRKIEEEEADDKGYIRETTKEVALGEP